MWGWVEGISGSELGDGEVLKPQGSRPFLHLPPARTASSPHLRGSLHTQNKGPAAPPCPDLPAPRFWALAVSLEQSHGCQRGRCNPSLWGGGPSPKGRASPSVAKGQSHPEGPVPSCVRCRAAGTSPALEVESAALGRDHPRKCGAPACPLEVALGRGPHPWWRVGGPAWWVPLWAVRAWG